MNKKIRGIMMCLLGIFFICLLANKNTIQQSNSEAFNTIKEVINISELVMGKMTWFVSILLVFFGLFDILFSDIKIKFHKHKIVALIIWFLSCSLLYIQSDVSEPITGDYLTIGSKLLEIGFNKESGGVIGALIAMPFYKFLHLEIIAPILQVIITVCVLLIFKEFIIVMFDMIWGLLKYYMSDEYKKKLKVLKAKKISEKQAYINEQKQKRDNMRDRLIESRKQKLSFEISKKPKESFLQKTEVYSESELIDKEKEWLKMIEESEKKETKEKDIEEKNIEEKIIEIKKDEIKKEKIDINITKEEEFLNLIKTEKKEEKVEEIIGKENEEKQKLEKEIIEKEIIEKVKEEKTLLNQKEELKQNNFVNENTNKIDLENSDYEQLLKKAIDEIFKAKPMDENRKKEIEKSIVENVKHLEEVLKEFGIDAKVVNYETGPTITRYEITIPKGVPVKKVVSLQNDIAMNLSALSVRIEAPIPGKNTIGIETPNKIKEPVHFSNIIRNSELNKGALNIILGKNIIGEDKIIDIAKMPHLLIAGQTGSGKSVAINTLISTLITKKTEKEVRFIMVDPKMVELMPYNDIPHLLVPVITEPQQAAIALKWAVNEMENRYRQLMENGVRNIEGYNKLGYVEKMPYIVIIIDELADLMMVASGSVEESIARIAQKARAIGIHLVVATQRPSTDVITGMIKANLPSRISFALRSYIDSKTILDTQGAEKLLGQGDMLLLANGSSNLERIQGAFISDEEVFQLVTVLKANKKVEYREEILLETVENNKDTDPLFENAIDIIKQEGRISISLLQRKLSVGFNRASRIYEQLKDNGIIDSENQLIIDDFEE